MRGSPVNSSARPDVQIVMPVHNEADCIRSVIQEIYIELTRRVQPELIVCEDGSDDGTKEILQELSSKIPMRLIMSNERKGYSQAVIDGIKASTADYVMCFDSDGQFSPRDFWGFYTRRQDYDLSIGCRLRRADALSRRLMSRCFRVLYMMLFHVPIHDPSCGYWLAKRAALNELINKLGTLKQGFAWELIARAHAKGFRIREVPIRHNLRKSGLTRVYYLHKLPRIAGSHILGLFRIWWQVRGRCACPGAPLIREA